jgi:hypothetical protein
MEPMLSLIDGAAAAHTTSSFRAACELLGAAGSGIRNVSVSGLLPDPDEGTLPVLAIAQRLATEYGLALQVRLNTGHFEVLFSRTPESASETEFAGA